MVLSPEKTACSLDYFKGAVCSFIHMFYNS